MSGTTTAVTPERFDRAFSYKDYLAAIAVNRDQFQHYYEIAQLTDDDAAFFRERAALPSGPAKILVIAEAWCPDVFRGVPVFARIAEASGMTMKIVLRDENPDIMDEFLLDGRARASAPFPSPSSTRVTIATLRIGRSVRPLLRPRSRGSAPNSASPIRP
jgi:hypothetical protein